MTNSVDAGHSRCYVATYLPCDEGWTVSGYKIDLRLQSGAACCGKDTQYVGGSILFRPGVDL